ncbi:MAG: hypothetical protein AAFV45_08490 [Pseudomonadota bacterium]
MFVRMSDSLLTRVMQAVFAFVVMPAMVGSAWLKAEKFDPYATSFFTKTYVEPTADMPDEMRLAGWVFIGIAAWLSYVGIKGTVKRIGKLRECLVLVWVACLIAAFGGAFFVAADAAQLRIAQSQKK